MGIYGVSWKELVQVGCNSPGFCVGTKISCMNALDLYIRGPGSLFCMEVWHFDSFTGVWYCDRALWFDLTRLWQLHQHDTSQGYLDLYPYVVYLQEYPWYLPVFPGYLSWRWWRWYWFSYKYEPYSICGFTQLFLEQPWLLPQFTWFMRHSLTKLINIKFDFQICLKLDLKKPLLEAKQIRGIASICNNLSLTALN